MRIRTNLIIEEALLTRIDQLAGDKNKRAAVIETALREYIEREEIKIAANPPEEVADDKSAPKNNRARV